MSPTTGQTDAPPAVRTLVERCRVMNLPLWSYDRRGEVDLAPKGWGDGDTWLAAPLLREMIARAQAAWRGTTLPTVIELMSGCWLLPLPAVDRDPDRRMHVAVALGPEVLDATLFATVCRSAHQDPVYAREALRPLAVHRRLDLEGVSRTLRWMHSDLIECAKHDHAVDNFSQQLVDTYEQMSMMYQLAELMSGLEDPRGFVRMVCELLNDTLDFQWTAVRFSSLTTLGRTLTNDLVLVGSIPCSYTRFDRLAGELTQGSIESSRPRIIDTRDDALAKLVAGDVFVNPLVCDGEIAGVLLTGSKKGRDPDISTVDMQLISATADYVSSFIHNSALYNEQRTMFYGIVKALSASIDAKDRYTRGHSERVAHLSSELALRTGMTEEQAERVRLAGTLHDMGKIGVPEAVLLKPGRLTDAEFDAIKRHPTIGYNILKDIEPLHDVLPGVLYHHERWDGKGYPHGLKGTAIPLLGRILAVADSFDAMSSDRAYRPRMARESVLMEMRRGAGSQWDADLVQAFLGLDFAKYDSMLDKHAAQESIAA